MALTALPADFEVYFASEFDQTALAAAFDNDPKPEAEAPEYFGVRPSCGLDMIRFSKMA